jgi:enoyl-CoA hydratase/carnithine racemase
VTGIGNFASHATLQYGTDGRVAHATFTRPDSGNSLSEQALDEINDVVARVQADQNVRTLVIRGQDDCFCSGLDEEVLEAALDDLEYFEHVLTRVAATCLSLEALEVPVIGAVNGLASGAGFELALACDVIVAAEEARIGDGHTAAGLIPGGGATVRLPRTIGAQHARELIYSSRLVSGSEAAGLGLVLRSVPLASLDASVAELAASFTDKPRRALAAVKRQINGGLGLDTPSGVEYERNEFIRYLREPHSDALEGFRAAREGRSPNWA